MDGLITTAEQYRVALDRWQAEHYHVLTPAWRISAVPPGYGVVATLVAIDPDPTHGDVYRDPLFCGSDEVALTKIGLARLAMALGMTIRSERIDPRTDACYWEVRATVRLLGLDGTPQELEATVEYDLRDGSPRVRGWRPRQLEAARTHGRRAAEARAINAAIRQIGVRQTYRQAELVRPFVAIRMIYLPDWRDPEVRRVVTAQRLAGTALLYERQALETRPTPLLAVPPASLPSGEPADDAAPPPVPELSATPTPPPVPELPPRAELPVATRDPDPPPPDDAPPTRIRSVRVREGETRGRSWRRYIIISEQGLICSTFDRDLGERAMAAQRTQEWVVLRTQAGHGTQIDLLEIQRVAGASA